MLLTRYRQGSSAVAGATVSMRQITEGRICLCLYGGRRHRHPSVGMKQARADAPRWKGRGNMGNGVTGSVNAPVNQTTNARNSASPADTAARLQFGKALEQQNICPEGLGRPSRYDPPCTYLRHPSQPPQPSQPVDIHYKGNPDHLKGPMNGSHKGTD